MRICFAAVAGCVCAFAADSIAAGVPTAAGPSAGSSSTVAAAAPARSSLTLPSSVTTVVKADPRTGRLVRSVRLAPKPVAEPIPAASPKASARAIAPEMAPMQTKPEAKAPDLSLRAGSDLQQIVDEASAKHNVDPLLVHSVIKIESNYNQYAISNKGAEGLMQLIPSTAKRFGATNSFDARQNIDAGVKYLKYLQDLYKDDRLALAAYNAGEGAVAKYKWIPPYAETQNYVYQVGKKYGEARRAYDRKKADEQPVQKAEAAKVEAPKPEHPELEAYKDEQGRLYLRTR